MTVERPRDDGDDTHRIRQDGPPLTPRLDFPVVIKRDASTAAPAQLYYELAENGVFQVRHTHLYRAVTRVEGGVPGLLQEVAHVELYFPRLPRALGQEVLAFFADVYHLHAGEAIVVLFYRHRTRDFHIGVPPQVLSGRRFGGSWRADHSVVYGEVARPQGFVRLGTIHSHADLPAYSSYIDCADEQFEDGLHVVFGDFHKPNLSIAAAFVANGTRFAVVPSDVLEPCTIPACAARPDWMALVKREDEPLVQPDPREG